MALFIDTFVNRIDRKGRVSVPATYRQSLAQQSFAGIVALPSFRFPAIHCAGIDWMQGLNERMSSVDLFSDAHDDLSVTLFGDAKQLAFDGEGRIVLSEALCRHAGLTDNAAFVGRGMHFEIWEPGALDRHKSQARQRALAQGRTLKQPDNTGPGGR
jgi:MraZ protein